MPELPEVETVRRGLAHDVVGREISSLSVSVPKLIKPPVTDVAEFERILLKSHVENVRRRGKYLIFELSNGYAVVAHLKMRGSFRYEAQSGKPDEPYLGVRISFTDGGELRYHDIWGWGEFRLLRNTPESLNAALPGLAGMGIEPFDDGFSAEHLREAAQRRVRTTIKACLLDQSVVAGVGNIYADESLFKARIRPDRLVGDLSTDEWRRLRDAIVGVLTEATEFGGTVSDNFFNPEGRAGAYEPLVYGRGGQPCPVCGIPLERIKITGRGTVYCPKCQ
ncbi:MAG TPA: DNA-formamidopyrimidine glycosylase [Capsulimonadaceae bacterium]|jgi:formamidopyrimidine-DNA glycosylase